MYNKCYIFVAKLILLHENTNLNLQKVSITHCTRYNVFALAMQNYGHYLNGVLPLPILKMNSSQKYLCLEKRWLYPKMYSVEINCKHMSDMSTKYDIVKHTNTQKYNNSKILNVVVVSSKTKF